MMGKYHIFRDLIDQIEVSSDGIRNLTLYDEEDAKLILFSFAQGAHFFEHTSPDPIQIHILEGEAVFTVREDVVEASQGTLLYIPAKTSHGVKAKKPLRLLVTFMKRACE